MSAHNTNIQYHKYIQYLETSTYLMLWICCVLLPFVLEYQINWLFELPHTSLIAGIDEEHNLKTSFVKPDKGVKEIMSFDGYFWHWNLTVHYIFF